MRRVVNEGKYDDKQSKKIRLVTSQISGTYNVYGLPVDIFILESR